MRSGFVVTDSSGFAERIERMLRLSMGVSLDEAVSTSLHHISRGVVLSSTTLFYLSCNHLILFYNYPLFTIPVFYVLNINVFIV